MQNPKCGLWPKPIRNRVWGTLVVQISTLPSWSSSPGSRGQRGKAETGPLVFPSRVIVGSAVTKTNRSLSFVLAVTNVWVRSLVYQAQRHTHDRIVFLSFVGFLLFTNSRSHSQRIREEINRIVRVFTCVTSDVFFCYFNKGQEEISSRGTFSGTIEKTPGSSQIPLTWPISAACVCEPRTLALRFPSSCCEENVFCFPCMLSHLCVCVCVQSLVKVTRPTCSLTALWALWLCEGNEIMGKETHADTAELAVVPDAAVRWGPRSHARVIKRDTLAPGERSYDSLEQKAESSGGRVRRCNSVSGGREPDRNRFLWAPGDERVSVWLITSPKFLNISDSHLTCKWVNVCWNCVHLTEDGV